MQCMQLLSSYCITAKFSMACSWEVAMLPPKCLPCLRNGGHSNILSTIPKNNKIRFSQLSVYFTWVVCPRGVGSAFTPWVQSWIWVLFFKQSNHWKWILVSKIGRSSLLLSIILHDMGWKINAIDGIWRLYLDQINPNKKDLCKWWHVQMGTNKFQYKEKTYNSKASSYWVRTNVFFGRGGEGGRWP